MSELTCPQCHWPSEKPAAGRAECANPECEVAFFGPATIPAQRTSSTGRTFPARYPGHCHSCGEHFAEGELIGFDEESDLCCAECLGKAKPEPKPLDVCQKCFMARATNGTCGCDD